MKRDRVKFYSPRDITNGISLEKAEQIIKKFDDKNKYSDFNDIIEFYNIKCFFEHDIYLVKWTKEDRTELTNKTKDFMKHIGKLFRSITAVNLLQIFNDVDSEYTEDFWSLINKLEVYNNFTSAVLNEIFKTSNFRIYEVLQQQKITRHFGAKLREYILSDCKNAELILDKYAVQQDHRFLNLHFPLELTNDDMGKLILQYIHSNSINPNYLTIIGNMQSTKEFSIPYTTILEAKREYKKYVEEHFKNNKGFEFGVEVWFNNEQSEVKLADYRSGKLKTSYSTTWIKENLDFPTLLNNFIYLFEFTDLQCRSLHTHKEQYLGVLEKHLGIKGRNEYFTGIAFQQTQALSILQMISYRNLLQNLNIRMEDIFQWFFTNYLGEEFGITNFRISMPSEQSTALEKCRMIATEIEGILKQYFLFVEYGHIDHELLQIYSTHLFYKDVKSNLTKKYLYGKGDIYHLATYYFFSDQCMLFYIPRIERRYDTFYELLSHEKVYLYDYLQYESDLSWLIEQGFLSVGNDNSIQMDIKRVNLLKELYENEAGCLNYLRKFEDVIVWMETRNMVEYETTLFSRPEQDYLNYLMNRSEFSNGLDLRNKYLHATQPISDEIHEKDYNIFLTVLVLVIIKINEEFCLQQKKVDSINPEVE